MKTIVRICLLAGALAAVRVALWAVEPAAAPRTAGKVLVLENGRTFEGDIERHGEQYRIQRGTSEVWVPATPSMRLCADWQDAFEFMTSRANLLDGDERLRLARWCQVHGLNAQALSEAIAATRMQPENKEALQMKILLERAVAAGPAQSALQPATGGAVAVPAPVLDISSESVALFTTKVQPILMNTCVSCHAAGKGRQFQVFRAFEGGQRAATQKNLAAVLDQVNVNDPHLSPLLIKAVSAHAATGQAPIKDKKAIPYQVLEYWVDQLLVSNPHLRGDRSATAKASYPTPAPREVPLFHSPKLPGQESSESRAVPHLEDKVKNGSEPRAVPVAAVASTPAVARDILPPAAKTPAISEAGPTVPAAPASGISSPGTEPPSAVQQTTFSEQHPDAAGEPSDEFDPLIFNRQAHPQR